MRKFLFSVLVALCAALPAGATTWGIVGDMTQWDNDIVMTEQPDGTFTVTLPSFSGTFKFRGDFDWNLNLGMPGGVTDEITGNVTYPLQLNGANLRFAGTVENVTFTLDPSVPSVVISGLPTDMDPIVVPELTDLYLIGGPAGWSANSGWLMSHNLVSDKYSIVANFAAGDYYAFASRLGESESDWDTLNANRYGPATDGTVPADGAATPIVKIGDTAWKCEKGGRYRMDVDLDAMTLEVNEEIVGAVWSIIGAFNNWSADVDLTPDGTPGVYSVTMKSFGGEFKFRADHSWDLCFGAVDDGIIAGDGVYQMSSEVAAYNFRFPEFVESVTFTIDVTTSRLTVSGMDDSGIEDVTAGDAAGAVYYNLQGIRVDNPADGIFIKVAGGKSSKVRL